MSITSLVLLEAVEEIVKAYRLRISTAVSIQ